MATRMLLGEFLDEWFETCRMSVGPARLHNDRRYVERHIRPQLGGVALRGITAPRLNALYADIRDHGRSRGTGPLAHASILLASGEPPKVVQERLGHHSTAFTHHTCSPA